MPDWIANFRSPVRPGPALVQSSSSSSGSDDSLDDRPLAAAAAGNASPQVQQGTAETRQVPTPASGKTKAKSATKRKAADTPLAPTAKRKAGSTKHLLQGTAQPADTAGASKPAAAVPAPAKPGRVLAAGSVKGTLLPTSR